MKFIFDLLKRIEDTGYLVRESFWHYPDLIFEDNPRRRQILLTYTSTAPYSHFLFSIVVFFVMFIIFFVTGIPKIASSGNTLIEAVVMGSDGNGQVQKITKINPLLPSNVQLEKDLVNLIYEPLLKFEYEYKEDGKAIGAVKYVLVRDAVTVKPGADYIFNLRDDVFWHDSTEASPKRFSADDVISTFDILSRLEANNSSTIALRQLRWEKLDDNTIRICTKINPESTSTCAESDNNPIFSNFLELLSFKIIPEHKSKDMDNESVEKGQSDLFKSPVGTGKYKIDNVSENSISLALFKDHYSLRDTKISVKEIRFIYFKNLESATFALENGEVHALASSSIEFSNKLSEYPQITAAESPVIYTQFWGLYFNLRKRPDGTTIGPEFLQDKNVRRAISIAINRDSIIEDSLKGAASETYSSIPAISYFFANTTKFANYYENIEYWDLSQDNKNLVKELIHRDLLGQKIFKPVVDDNSLQYAIIDSMLTSHGLDPDKFIKEFTDYLENLIVDDSIIKAELKSERDILIEAGKSEEEAEDLVPNEPTAKDALENLIDFDNPQIISKTIEFTNSTKDAIDAVIEETPKVNPNEILDEAGWTLRTGEKIRTNAAGSKLSFSLYFVENYDRRLVAESIKSDLEKIGIEVKINRREQPGQENALSDFWSLEELNNIVVAPRSFDVLFYGMDTFIDPDRYELYHSSQIENLGLNIAGYKGTEESVEKNPNPAPGESSVIRVSKVDKFLEQARSYNPETNRKERKERYDEIQGLINNDMPVVYLYHPRFIYYSNKALENIHFGTISSIEERFDNISEWEIR